MSSPSSLGLPGKQALGQGLRENPRRGPEYRSSLAPEWWLQEATVVGLGDGRWPETGSGTQTNSVLDGLVVRSKMAGP